MADTADGPIATPEVSVVIPAYNAARTLGRALDSVARQAHPNLEVIVVDDCSSDGTVDVACGRTDLSVRLLRMRRNLGASAARNAGIAASRGIFVAFLDADDEWLDDKLVRQLALFRADPAFGLVGSRYRQIFASGEAPRIKPEGDLVGGEEAWQSLMADARLQTSTVVLRRSLVANESYAFDETLRLGEDQDLWIRLALRCKVGYVDDCLVNKHESAHSLSAQEPLANARFMLPVIRKHLRANAERLGPGQARRIMAARLAKAGRDACYAGYYLFGTRLIVRAMLLGNRPASHLLFLLKTAPPVLAAARARQRAAEYGGLGAPAGSGRNEGKQP